MNKNASNTVLPCVYEFYLYQICLLCSNLHFESHIFRNAHPNQIYEVSEDPRKVSEIDSAYIFITF